VKPVVRHFISPDVDLDNFNPSEPDNFSFLLQALVGPIDQEGEESLQFVVCTPRNLAERLSLEKVIFGRSYVIVEFTDIRKILEAVRAAIQRIEGPTWVDVGRRLSRLGVYEFEDFV
jgi:Immunity protein 8